MITNKYGQTFVFNRLDVVKQLDELSRDGDKFDLFVVIKDHQLQPIDVSVISMKLVKLNCEWIEIFGTGAEVLHDEIDKASVVVGRQIKVGDGDPMTCWKDDNISINDIANYVWSGGQGTSNWKLVLVIGDVVEMEEIFTAIQSVALS